MGTVSDRIGVKNTIIISLSLILATFILIQFIDQTWMFYVFAAFYGFGYGAMIAMQTLTSAKIFGLASLGMIVGVVTCAYTSGGAIGATVTGYIFDVTGNYYTAFGIWAGLAFGGLALALTLPQPKKAVRHKLISEKHPTR